MELTVTPHTRVRTFMKQDAGRQPRRSNGGQRRPSDLDRDDPRPRLPVHEPQL